MSRGLSTMDRKQSGFQGLGRGSDEEKDYGVPGVRMRVGEEEEVEM